MEKLCGPKGPLSSPHHSPGPLHHALPPPPKASAQSKRDTHIGPSQAAELVLQVAGEVIGFLDGGARPWISCAV